MHWQAEDAAGAIFADREVPLFIAKPGKSLLEVERLRVIDGCRDAGILEFGLEFSSVFLITSQEGVLGPRAFVPLGYAWRRELSAWRQEFRVALGDLLAEFNFFREDPRI